MLYFKFPYVFLLKVFFQQSRCLYSIYRLNQENPSFAIHGVNLDRLGSITIYGHNESDFLVDFSQRGCVNNPDHSTNDQLLMSPNEMINCFDPFPLSINGGIPEKDKCKEVMPYDQNFTKLLYMCSFKVRNTSQLIVKSLSIAVSLEYATSFRVSHWVDESRHILVVPTDDTPTENVLVSNNVLLRAGVLAIIVENPLVYKSGTRAPYTNIWPTVDYDYNMCLLFQIDSNCPRDSIFSVYVGSDPGLAKSHKYHIADANFLEDSDYNVRSSVISVFSKRNDCNLCMAYMVDNSDYPEGLYIGPELHSSNNYLWDLEDPNDFHDCISIYVTPFYFWEASSEIKLEFIAFEGIRMNITGFKNRQGNQRCVDPILNYQRSFESMPEMLWMETDCLQIDWCPVGAKQERFGFKAWISTKLINATEELCMITYQLTEDQPQAIFHTFNMRAKTGEYGLICVFQDCPLDNICPLIIDYAINCPRRDMNFCKTPSTWDMLEINNDIPQMSNCTFWEFASNLSFIVQCKTMVNGHAYFRQSPNQEAQLYLESAISIRVPEWTNDNSTFYLLPNSVYFEWDLVFDFIFPVQDQETWIIMALAMPNTQLLRSFTSSHSFKDCDYRVIVGAPDRKHLHPKRNLFTIKGKDRFIEQSLESELYSFLIPPGCSPSIVQKKLGDAFSVNHFEKEQEICDGVSIITSHGYLNPFEINNSINGYYLLRNITCHAFELNLTLEIIDIGDGDLTIIAYEKDSEIKHFCDLNASLPITCSFSEISIVQIKWIPHHEEIQREDGCFIRVHVSKSLPLLTPPIDSRKELITSTNSFQSRPSTLLAFLLIVFAYHTVIITQ